jgi:hypothetical protein
MKPARKRRSENSGFLQLFSDVARTPLSPYIIDLKALFLTAWCYREGQVDFPSTAHSKLVRFVWKGKSVVRSDSLAQMARMQSVIYEHSQAPQTGIVAFRARSGTFEFVVCDSGIGVLQSLTSCPEFSESQITEKHSNSPYPTVFRVRAEQWTWFRISASLHRTGQPLRCLAVSIRRLCAHYRRGKSEVTSRETWAKAEGLPKAAHAQLCE